jgi:fucose permease
LVHRNLINYLVYAIMFLFAMVLTVLSPLLTEIAKTFSLGLAETGIIFTANFLGFVLFIFIGGILADRIGKKRVLCISLAGFTLSLLLLPLVPNFFWAFMAIILIGGFGGSIEGAVSALIMDVNPDRPSFYLNFTQVFFGLGAIIGPVGAGILISKGFSWQLCYFILAGLSLALTTGFIMMELPVLPKFDKITLGSFAKLIADPKLMIVCLCMLFYTGSEIGGWGWMSTFFKQNLKFSATKSSTAVALFWGGMTVGRFICGRLSLRYNIRNIIIGLAFLAAVVTVLSGFFTSEWAVLAIVIAMGLAYSSLWPLIASYGGNYHQEYSGTVFALLISSGGIGAMLIPYIMGVLAQNIDIRMAMISPGILFFLIAVIFVNLKRAPGPGEKAV